MPAAKIPFDPSKADVECARQVVLSRLRTDHGWHQLDLSGEGFDPFVEYIASPGWSNGRYKLAVLAQEIFWQLVGEGVLSPGYDYSNAKLPFFHITEYGEKVLASTEPQPYDPSGYLEDLRNSVARVDPTVLAYLAESLETFRKGNVVASTVMLGIAAERVFLLIASSLADALANTDEKSEFSKRLKSVAIKPKLDWMHEKFVRVQKQRILGFPENATIMTIAIYDLIRCQRNDLGHPQEVPPNAKRADALVNLRIFPRYYVLAEEVRSFLASHRI